MHARGDIMRAGAALELSLEHVDPEHASGMVTLAALRDRIGDTAGAIALTRRALELEPDRPIALGNLALYLGRDPATRAEALVLAERAARLRPWRADAWEGLARLRAAVGDVEGAAQARREAESRTDLGARQP
jgi:predicted Zn-dependent protease